MQTTRYDIAFRILMPATLIIMTALAQGLLTPPFSAQRLAILIRVVVFIVLTFELGRFAIVQIQKRMPLLSQTRKRLFLSYLCALVLAFAFITFSTLLSRLLAAKNVSFAYESLFNFLQCIWIGLLIAAPQELFYTYAQSVQVQLEKEESEKETVKAQLQSLQSKMSPHFFFNTLNTLTALIVKDPEKAEDFAVEMAFVYRYLLNNAQEQLVTVQEELNFVRAYMHLLQVRFNNEVHLNVLVEDTLLAAYLPPLTIQLLVENAVKHNTFSRENPLLIEIKSEGGDRIKIVNTLQQKEDDIASTKVGLDALNTRYRLLKQPPVIINKTNGQFSVTVSVLFANEKEYLPY